MFRFTTPEKKSFNLDYLGEIWCIDDEDNLIAKVASYEQGQEALEDYQNSTDAEFVQLRENGPVLDMRYVRTNPEDWDCWELEIETTDNGLFQKMLSTAFMNMRNLQYYIVKHKL